MDLASFISHVTDDHLQKNKHISNTEISPLELVETCLAIGNITDSNSITNNKNIEISLIISGLNEIAQSCRYIGNEARFYLTDDGKLVKQGKSEQIKGENSE